MALRQGRYHARLIGHTDGTDRRPLYATSCGDPRHLMKNVGEYAADHKDLFVAAGCGTWKHAKYLSAFANGRDLYAFADPCCGSASASASGSVGSSGSAGSASSGGCVISCCPNPKPRYYVTLTNAGVDVGFGYGCDCVSTVTVPVDLTIAEPSEPFDCLVWRQWDGQADYLNCPICTTVPGSEGTNDYTFYARLTCAEAGHAINCDGWVLRAQIQYRGVPLNETDWVPFNLLSCNCAPFHLVFDTQELDGIPDPLDSHCDSVTCNFSAEVTA